MPAGHTHTHTLDSICTWSSSSHQQWNKPETTDDLT